MFSTRLEEFLRHINETATSFEPIIGVSKGAIYKPIRNKKTVGVEVLEKIVSKYPSLNLEWLITGNGEMLKPGTISSSKNEDVHLISTPKSTPNSKSENLGVQNTDITKPGSENENVEVIHRGNNRGNSKSEILPLQKVTEPVVQYIVRDNYDMIDVPLLDMAAAANSTSGYLAPDDPDTIDHLLLPVSMLKKGRQNYAFRVVNDSMEPTLYMDDIIIVSHVTPGNYDQLREDRVCVVVSKSKGVIVKRIRNRLKENNLIRCRSDNKFYHSFNVYAEDLLNIFEVRCKISFNLPNKTAGLQDQINKLEERIEDIQELLKRKPI
jgi:phage repressor protein C with HTH and peptisase S24 domain